MEICFNDYPVCERVKRKGDTTTPTIGREQQWGERRDVTSDMFQDVALMKKKPSPGSTALLLL